MATQLGTRVVRGPNWQWENQDGGEGCVGTVVQLGQEEGNSSLNTQVVLVQWDCGNKANYRAGMDGKHDLKVLDNTNEGVTHVSVSCDGCDMKPIEGLRWHCLTCPNFDLCTTCYMSDEHNLRHTFERLERSRGKRTLVGTRNDSAKVQFRGIFKGAKVVRGPDWEYGDQDGGSGMEGVVTEITDWNEETKNDAARVLWEKGKMENIYRVGNKEKVDLKCTTPVTGGSYYRDHLPLLTVEVKKTMSGFTTGEKVYVHVTTKRLKELSVNHGGWNDDMETFIRKFGVVQDFTPSGDVVVEYSDTRWRYNPEALKKVPTFKRGEIVKVESDRQLVEELQQGHKEWHELMTIILGRCGSVLDVDGDGDLLILIDGLSLFLNPLAVMSMNQFEFEEGCASGKTRGGKQTNKEGDAVIDYSSFSLAEACKANCVSRVGDILDAHPEKINEIERGLTPLQLACHAGHKDVTKLLLDRGADPDLKDGEGYTAIHHAAFSDRDGEVLNLLLERGINPNVKNPVNGSTPLHLTVSQSNFVAVRILTKFPGCDINAKNDAGDTPLYEAITEQKNQIADIFLENPRLSMTVTNRDGFNYLHYAVLKGNTRFVEKLLDRGREILDVPKSDGLTALHIAAINDQCDAARLLIRQSSAVDVVTTNKQTPLHIAAAKGHTSMVELLLDNGADVNAEDDDGDTALHISLSEESRHNLLQMASLHDQMLLGLGPVNRGSQAFAASSRCLLSYGASVHRVNKKGEMPLNKCSGTKVEALVKDISKSGGSRVEKSPRFLASVRSPNQACAAETSRSTCAREGSVPGGNVTNDTTVQMTEQNPNDSERSEDDFTNLQSPQDGGSPGAILINDLYKARDEFKNILSVMINGELPENEAGDDNKNFDNEVQQLVTEHNHLGNSDKKLKDPEGYKGRTAVQENCDHSYRMESREQLGEEALTDRVNDDVNVVQCQICEENVADVVFKPCGHSIVCTECSCRMKRCLKCKVKITARGKRGGEPVIRMNDKSITMRYQVLETKMKNMQAASVCCVCSVRQKNVFFLCGHGTCHWCAKELEICPTCQEQIDQKINVF